MAIIPSASQLNHHSGRVCHWWYKNLKKDLVTAGFEKCMAVIPSSLQMKHHFLFLIPEYRAIWTEARRNGNEDVYKNTCTQYITFQEWPGLSVLANINK